MNVMKCELLKVPIYCWDFSYNYWYSNNYICFGIGLSISEEQKVISINLWRYNLSIGWFPVFMPTEDK